MRADRLARLHGAVNRQLGEDVRVMPQTDGGYTIGGDDGARAATTITAEVAEVPNAVRTSGNAANSGANVDLRAVARTVKFTTSDLPYTVVAGDHVILLDRDNEEWRVNGVFPFGTDRTVLRLEKVSA